MSTRCITRIIDFDGTEICCIYRHCDGYPDGHGKELQAFLRGKKIINGYGPNDKRGINCFNGMQDLAAAFIYHFYPKTSIYVLPPGSEDTGEEYTYTVTGKLGKTAKVTCK